MNWTVEHDASGRAIRMVWTGPSEYAVSGPHYFVCPRCHSERVECLGHMMGHTVCFDCWWHETDQQWDKATEGTEA